jgi:hypothetical protein
MYCSGVDLLNNNSCITTLNDAGEIVKQERLPNVPEVILANFASLTRSAQSGRPLEIPVVAAGPGIRCLN